MTDISFFNNDASVVASMAMSIGLGVVSLYFKWLISSFKELREMFKEVKLTISGMQELAQHRHEENLRRFEKISVALARLGSTNGTYEGIKT